MITDTIITIAEKKNSESSLSVMLLFFLFALKLIYTVFPHNTRRFLKICCISLIMNKIFLC